MTATDFPTATYRLQLSGKFGFDDAAALVPYLKALGISHLYASPFLKARAGSTHGYDIVDHNQLNPEFGGEEAFGRLSAALTAADIGLILDFVPNHMGVFYADNVWWLDVLEWGERSPHAASFDIDWDLLAYRRDGGVLLPILGRPYGDALENGEIELKYDPQDGSFSAWYYEHRLPIIPYRYGEMLETAVRAADAADTAPGRAVVELANRHRGPRSPSPEQAPAFKAAIAAVAGGAAVIERGLDAYRPRRPDDRAKILALHHLLERQAYRLAHWQVAVSEINYRRFFDVNSLAGIRVENPATFRASHQLVTRLIAQGRLQGIRLDHIDGLRDPLQYCRRLQSLIREAQGSRRPFYVLVEKILGDGEPMPTLPGVAGTTGYEWLNVISRVLVDDRGLAPLEQFRREFTENDRGFDEILERAKLRILENILASEFTVLTRLLARIAAGHYASRDFGIVRLEAAFKLFVLKFPVYRTYVTGAGASSRDRATIDQAISAARAEWFGSDASIFDFLRDALALDLIAAGRIGYSGPRVRRFALKVQQFTGPMMAKSLEDTAFYRYHRLQALNEVGGDPPVSGLSVADFHAMMAARNKNQPYGMTATATHDTKRGEDARVRLLAVAELTDEWREAAAQWRSFNAGLIDRSGPLPAPVPGHEYMLYQTLLGAWPLGGPDRGFAERFAGYAIKAAREGKVETSWTNPNEAYEKGLLTFVRRMLDRRESARFIDAFDAFARRTALLGALNGLSQLTLKATMPGMPDFYQGTEFWDFALVDPDNRQPVDFATRTDALARLQGTPDWSALVRDWQNAEVKLALTHKLLVLRSELAMLFRDGDYQPIEVRGRDRDHVVAFARSLGRDVVIVAVGRHWARITAGGREWPAAGALQAELQLGDFASLRDVLAPNRTLPSAAVPLGGLFDPLPVAVLRGQPARGRKVKGQAAPPPSSAA